MSTSSIRRVAPTLVVFGVLAGLAWWGHRNGWVLPKFSALTGQTATAKDDWCEAHGVPESICVECDSSLMPRPKKCGWCVDHGVHECVMCNPELAQLDSPYPVSAAMRERAKTLAADRPANNQKCTLHERRIQFASLEAFRKSGVDVKEVGPADVVESIPVTGEIVYDQGRVAHLSPRAAGSVTRVFFHLGDQVKAGNLLALVEASEVGKAKSEFGQAGVQWQAKRTARERLRPGEVSEAKIAEADTALREARVRVLSARQALINLGLPATPEDQRLLADEQLTRLSEDELARSLHFLGVPDEALAGLDKAALSNNLLAMRSPSTGYISSNDIVRGEVVDPSRPVFTLVDPSRVWLMLDLKAEDVEKVTPKQTKVLFKPAGARKDDVEGVITWLSTEADEKTRTVKARAELKNDDGKLRAKQFGSGRIVLREEKGSMVVPSSAVHWEGDCHVVFVADKNWLTKDSPKVFHTRVVRVGMRDDARTEIIAGVLPGEIVATKGSEVLRAELLRGNFGEGCGCCK